MSEFEKKWDHYNYGLNKVANRFGSLKFLLAYNNNKITSENVGKSYFQLNSGSWLLAPGSWLLPPDTIFRMVANRCLKMRAPVNVKDGVRFPVVVVTSELSYNSGRNNTFHGLNIGFVLFVLFSPKTT